MSSSAYANAATLLLQRQAEHRHEAEQTAPGCAAPRLDRSIYLLTLHFWGKPVDGEHGSMGKWRRYELYFSGDPNRGSPLNFSAEYPRLHEKVAELLPADAKVFCVQFVREQILLYYQHTAAPSQ